MRAGTAWGRVVVVSLVALLLTAAWGDSQTERAADPNPDRQRGVSRRLSDHEGLAALELIGAVRQEMTLHSVCFVPQEKTMYVCVPAIGERTVEFRLDEWFNRPMGRTGQRKQAAFQGGQP